MIIRVDSREALAEWSFYAPFIQRVIDKANSGSSVEDVLTCLQLGSMQLWRDGKRKAVAVTEIQDYPRYRMLLVYMVAGKDVRDWLAEGQQQLDSFAKQSGCKYIEFQGRAGWEKLCRELGYDNKMIRMRKEL